MTPPETTDEADTRLRIAAYKALALIDDMSRFVEVMALKDYALFNEAPIELRAALANLQEQEKGTTRCSDEQASEDGLYGATPNCDGRVRAQRRGGVKCDKCGGWFCF